ncbi:MAG: methyltransferase domain-containing protein [Bacilli bacterium]|nr:methyltransferase domain-containing protein [Bacilli bacterium]
MAKITDIAHLFLKEHLKVGDTAIDATCGNGHDTLYLAKLVGQTGIVHAYDIQEQAIINSKELTKDFNNIIFHQTSHENIDINKIDAVIFNLGYLPNGDKQITTLLSSTKNAILNLIAKFETNKNMLIIIVVYPGHDEGYKEALWLDEYLTSLPTSFVTSKYQPINQHNSPYIYTVNKK